MYEVLVRVPRDYAWWYTLVIVALEVEAGGSEVKRVLLIYIPSSKPMGSMRPYL